MIDYCAAPCRRADCVRQRVLPFVLLEIMLLVGTAPPLLAAPAAHAPVAQAAAPQIASYRMDVQLDPQAKTVHGTEQITYRNPSNDTLRDVWLHLYLKAFSSPDTIWMQEGGGRSRGYAADVANLGNINVEALTSNGTDLLPSSTITDTLMHVPLPAPLAPQTALTLDVRWTGKLPRVFARTGYGGRDDTFFMVGQWYPKMAVYDRGRWDTEPWHQSSEFFHDFGAYDVHVTVPDAYVVAGVGEPAGEQRNNNDTKTLHFTATDVTDFAFGASPDFQTQSTKAGDADVVLYYLPEHKGSVNEYLRIAAGSLTAYSTWYGAYPHRRLPVVDVPDNAAGAGGMEYPTLVTGGSLGTGSVGFVTAHEVGHQWWPMQTATNEAREPWLDEGLTEYSGVRYMAEQNDGLRLGPVSIPTAAYSRATYGAASGHPANLPAWKYDGASYGSAVYNKSAVGLWTLENVVGTVPFRRAMSDYLTAYRFKHPTAADFRRTMETSLHADLGWFFDDFIAGTGVIDYAVDGTTNTNAGSTVTLRRLGSVRAPVDVLFTHTNGAQTTEHWNGAEQTTTFGFAAGDPVARVQIDPDHKLVAELDVLNNGRTVEPQIGAVVTLGGRLSFWMQTLVNMLGFAG